MPLAKIVHPIETMVQENNLAILGNEESLDVFTNTFGLPLTLALFAFSMLALVILNFPRKKETQANLTAGITDFSAPLKVERSVIWFRYAAGAGVCMVPLFFYLLDIIRG